MLVYFDSRELVNFDIEAKRQVDAEQYAKADAYLAL